MQLHLACGDVPFVSAKGTESRPGPLMLACIEAAPDPLTLYGTAARTATPTNFHAGARRNDWDNKSRLGYPVARLRASPGRKSVVPFVQAPRRGAPVALRDPCHERCNRSTFCYFLAIGDS